MRSPFPVIAQVPYPDQSKTAIYDRPDLLPPEWEVAAAWMLGGVVVAMLLALACRTLNINRRRFEALLGLGFLAVVVLGTVLLVFFLCYG
jgi:hypothetical protein